MQQDPPPPPPTHPSNPIPTHTHFYADSGKKEKFAAHIWSLCADSQRPNKVTVGVTERGQGPRDTGSTRGNREVGVWEEEGGGRAAVADNGGKTEDGEEGSACSQEMMAVG